MFKQTIEFHNIKIKFILFINFTKKRKEFLDFTKIFLQYSYFLKLREEHQRFFTDFCCLLYIKFDDLRIIL